MIPRPDSGKKRRLGGIHRQASVFFAGKLANASFFCYNRVENSQNIDGYILAERVSDAAFRRDDVHLTDRFQLFAQVVHINVHDVAVRIAEKFRGAAALERFGVAQREQKRKLLD